MTYHHPMFNPTLIPTTFSSSTPLLSRDTCEPAELIRDDPADWEIIMTAVERL
jgi:hypothetical protein